MNVQFQFGVEHTKGEPENSVVSESKEATVVHARKISAIYRVIHESRMRELKQFLKKSNEGAHICAAVETLLRTPASHVTVPGFKSQLCS